MTEVFAGELREVAQRLWGRREKDLAELVDGLVNKPTNDPRRYSLGKIVKETVGLSMWSIFLEVYSNKDNEDSEEDGDAKSADLALVYTGVRNRLDELYAELDRREKTQYKLPRQS